MIEKVIKYLFRAIVRWINDANVFPSVIFAISIRQMFLFFEQNIF